MTTGPTGTERPTPAAPPASLGGDVARAAAPWLAVGIGLVWLSNAWPAIGLYHLQVVAWRLVAGRLPALQPRGPVRARRTIAAAPAVAALVAGPAAYLLLPLLAPVALADWLVAIGLGSSFGAMAVYFALIHPALEESHWAPLRERRSWAHLAFGGYHALVLAPLLGWPLACAVAVGLAGVSWSWTWLSLHLGSRVPALLSHAAADVAVIVAALALVS